MMCDFLDYPLGDLDQKAELVRLVVETDFLPCLAKILATMDDAAVLEETSALLAGPSAPSLITGSSRVLTSTLRLIAFRNSSRFANKALLEALRTSGIVEHLFRALLRAATCRPDHVIVPPGVVDGPPHGFLFQYVGTAVTLVSMLTICRGVQNNDELNRWAAATLSGPALQHVMLLHVVAQLCAADGGSDYGTPSTARLPVLHINPATRNPSANTKLPLSTESVINVVDFWLYALNEWHSPRASSTGQRVPQISNAAVRALCARLADAANARLEAERGEAPLVPAAPAGRSSNTAAAISARAVFDPALCRPLAERALLCAVTSFPDATYEGMSRLWRPIVRTLRNVLASEGREALADYRASQVLELLRLRFLPFMIVPVPNQPPAGVAAAVAAGYEPCLEAMLRRAHSGDYITAATVGLQSINDHFSPFTAFGNFFAYGDLRATSSLLGTGAKLLHRAATRAAPRPEPNMAFHLQRGGLLRSLGDFIDQVGVVSGLQMWLTVYVEKMTKVSQDSMGAGGGGGGEAARGPPPAFWWLRDDFFASSVHPVGGCATSAPGAGSGAGPSTSSCQTTHVAAVAGSTSTHTGAGAGAGASPSGGAGAGTWRNPTTQLLVMSTWSLCRWLPAVARNARSCLQAAFFREQPVVCQAGVISGVKMVTCVLGWVAALSNAYIIAANRAASDVRMARAAASWRRLLQDVDILGLAQLQLSFLAYYWAQHGNTEQRAEVLAKTLPQLAWAMAEDLRDALRAPLRPPPGVGPLPTSLAGLSTLEVLKVVMGPQSCAAYDEALQVLDYVASGGELQALEMEQMTGTSLMSLVKLLPPPCTLPAVLGWAPCSNPCCENLAGDCEADLELHRCSGRCGGCVAYCGRECQAAHWKAGHKAECGKK